MFEWFKNYHLKQVCYMYLSNSNAISSYKEFYKLKIEMDENELTNSTWLRMFERLSKENHLIYEKLKVKQYTKKDTKKLMAINRQLKDHYKLFPMNPFKNFVGFVTPLLGWDREIKNLIEDLSEK
jgi:hypothetical protein